MDKKPGMNPKTLINATLAALPAWIILAIIVLVLAGCTTSGPPRVCETCIGPYDIALTSHREALFGKDHRP